MITYKQYSNEPIQEWIITKEDWNEFVKMERKNKVSDNIYFGIGILLLGVPTLMLLRQSNFLLALTICIPLAIIIPLMRMVIGSSYLKRSTNKVMITFYEDVIVANGKKIKLNDQNKRWIKSIKILPSQNIPLLEITVEWQTSKGRTFEEFRFPITSKYEDKINSLLARYKS